VKRVDPRLDERIIDKLDDALDHARAALEAIGVEPKQLVITMSHETDEGPAYGCASWPAGNIPENAVLCIETAAMLATDGNVDIGVIDLGGLVPPVPPGDLL
jgi:hypothetical protein